MSHYYFPLYLVGDSWHFLVEHVRCFSCRVCDISVHLVTAVAVAAPAATPLPGNRRSVCETAEAYTVYGELTLQGGHIRKYVMSRKRQPYTGQPEHRVYLESAVLSARPLVVFGTIVASNPNPAFVFYPRRPRPPFSESLKLT